MSEQQAIEDLEFIKKIINDARKKILDNGLGFIIWGILIVIGLVSTYTAVKFRIELTYGWNWIAVISIGWLYTFFEVRKEKRKNKPYTFASKILGMLWGASGIAMTIIGMVGTFSGAFHGVYISPLISSVLGVAYFVSGYIQDKMWVRNLAFGWWTGAVIMFIFPYLYTLLLMAAMLVCFQIVPGIIFYREWKENKIEMI